MNFADLKKGAAVFADANVLIYHFTNQSKSRIDPVADSP